MRALAAIALALLFVPSASAVESTIYPGVGIDKVELGMTKAQVEKILGGDGIVDSRDTIAGHSYLQLGWNFDSWSVGFVLDRGRYHAVRIGTTMARQRTPSGVGPRTTWLKLVKTLPHGICTFRWTPPYGLEYLVPAKGGTQLLFTFRSVPPHRYYVHTYVVDEVVVRTATKRGQSSRPATSTVASTAGSRRSCRGRILESRAVDFRPRVRLIGYRRERCASSTRAAASTR